MEEQVMQLREVWLERAATYLLEYMVQQRLPRVAVRVSCGWPSDSYYSWKCPAASAGTVCRCVWPVSACSHSATRQAEGRQSAAALSVPMCGSDQGAGGE
jgi:hypothetical protein